MALMKSSAILPNCIIVDIDGTLANCDHRRPHITSTPKNWEAFNAAICDDTVHSVVYDLVGILKTHGWKIVLCSGRENVYRKVTEEWLRKWRIPYNALYMRAEKDYREDDVVKSELLDLILLDGHVPWFAMDDRTRVVNMWRARGIPCFQVAPGDF